MNENENDDSDINGKEEDDDDFWDFILEARGFIENKTMIEIPRAPRGGHSLTARLRKGDQFSK